MQDWHIPLIVATIVFGAFILWKVRPAFVSGRRGDRRGALREAKERIEAAKDEPARALALCEAGDLAASMVGGATSAIGFYLRAMRADATSPAIVDRAAKGLRARPRALESLLWRRLGAVPWAGATQGAARAALKHLAELYAGPLRNAPRAKALEHALDALPATPRDSASV